MMDYLTKDVFHVFSKEDLLTNWTWRGNQLDDETIATLIEEAKAFKNSMLWKILKSEAQWKSLKTLVESGEGKDDIAFTRQVGYVLKVFDDKLEEMAQ